LSKKVEVFEKYEKFLPKGHNTKIVSFAFEYNQITSICQNRKVADPVSEVMLSTAYAAISQ
jgi:predicted nucleic acid-binding protein